MRQPPEPPPNQEERLDALPQKLGGFLSRIGIRGPLRDAIFECLGDPRDAVAHTDDAARVAAVIAYTHARVPEMRTRVEESLQDDAHEPLRLLELFPWIVATYALGELREVYHHLAEHLRRPEAQNLKELTQQLSDKPLIAQLFAEWVYITQSPGSLKPQDAERD